jgi:ATP-dependent Clp protease ATP-binding subunit ClpA
VIERRIANPLSKRILGGEFAEGDTAQVGHENGEYTFGKKSAGKSRRKSEERVATT